jgi:hypothetical protein
VESQDGNWPLSTKRYRIYMRVYLRTGVLLAAISFIVAAGIGCSKSVSSIGSALQTAPPEVKKGWDLAMAAMNTNGYAVAIIELKKIRQLPGVSAVQGKAIDEASTKISDQMYAAANKDDPKAKAAIEDLRNAWQR